MAIVGKENEENWSWFLDQLKCSIGVDRPLVFISDRHWGLLLSIPKVFPTAFHSYCLHHMQNNVASIVKSGKGLWVAHLLERCAVAATHHDFERAIAKYRQIGGEKAIEFLKDKPFDHWADLFFPGNRYGENKSNVAESFNSWILKERHLPITCCLDGIRIKLMNQMSKRREEASTWSSVLCPKMENRLLKLKEEGFGWNVSRSSKFIFEVHSPISHKVDLENRICTCNQWRVTGFPCVHALKCIIMSRLNVYDFIEYYFTTKAYRASYSHVINPIPTFDKKDIISEGSSIVHPPKAIRGAGRPRVNRLGGLDVFHGKRNKCGKCKKFGHNRRSCALSG